MFPDFSEAPPPPPGVALISISAWGGPLPFGHSSPLPWTPPFTLNHVRIRVLDVITAILYFRFQDR